MNIVILDVPCCALLPLDNSWKNLVDALLNSKITTAANAVILPESVAHSASALIS